MHALHIWRLVPDRMRRAKVEFGSIITAAISHDGIVITRCTGKGVQAGGSGFVWRIGFAKLDGTIFLTLKSDKAIARSEFELLCRCVCGLIRCTRRGGIGNFRFKLENPFQIVADGTVTTNPEERQVAGDIRNPAIVTRDWQTIVDEAGHAIGLIIQRHISVAVKLDLAAADFEDQFLAGFHLIGGSLGGSRGSRRRSLLLLFPERADLRLQFLNFLLQRVQLCLHVRRLICVPINHTAERKRNCNRYRCLLERHTCSPSRFTIVVSSFCWSKSQPLSSSTADSILAKLDRLASRISGIGLWAPWWWALRDPPRAWCCWYGSTMRLAPVIAARAPLLFSGTRLSRSSLTP